MSVIKCFNRECHYWNGDGVDHCFHPYVKIEECFHGIIKKDGTKSKNFYFEELRSNQCQCGEAKRPNYSFCYECYCSLPRDLKVDLYSRIGDGYEEAYEASIRYLDEK